MSNVSSTPGSRPRKGVIGVLGVVAGGMLVTAVAIAAGEAADPSTPVGAVELATFTSCEALAEWGAEAQGIDDEADPSTTFSAVGEAVATEADVAAPQAQEGEVAASDGDDTGAGAARSAAVADGTNVAVEGVDEIDLVERLTEDVALVTSAARLSLVDLAAGDVRARIDVPWDAQVTYDAEAGVAWVVGQDETTGGVVVERVAVGDDTLVSEGRWTTTGWLVDARRVGGELHVVAADGFAYDGGGVVAPATEGDGTSVPGVAPATASVPFADGPVPCDEVLHPVVGSDPLATLLVTLPATGAVEPVRAAEVVGSGELVHVTTEAAYLATPHWGDGTGAAEQGPTTGIHRFDLATLQATGSGTVEGRLLDDFSMSEHEGVLRVAVTDDGGVVRGMPAEAPMAAIAVEDAPTDVPADEVATDDAVGSTAVAPPGVEGEALNEVVVLDTEGALDVVGRTERFGHPGETIHGVRFDGDVGYAVTFLQTDPFYVIDLADPTAPQVVGEVELPGFSSYLHPLGDDLVVGFGPGADGRASAKLFDVSDPAAPAVVDDLTLGEASSVTYDHHAYVDLGDGRFAVPATSYGSAATTSEVVVVDTSARTLVEEERIGAATVGEAVRALPTADGWALLADGEIVLFAASGAERGRVQL